MAFTATIILHGFAIFYFHMLDIKPLAMQRVLDRLSDCYLVISDTGLVVNFNWQFQEVFGKKVRDPGKYLFAGQRTGGGRRHQINLLQSNLFD